MKNKLIEVFIIVIFLSLFAFHNSIKLEIIESLKVFITILFPSIFPIFLISDLLIKYNFPKTLNKYLGKIIFKIFHVTNGSAYIIIMSMITGFPSSAKNIKTLLEDNKITQNEANYLIIFTHFANPIFVITIANYIFNNIKYAYLILLSMYLSNFIIGFITRPKIYKEHKIKLENKNNHTFSYNLADSISNAMSLLSIILGTTCFFYIITSIIINFFHIKYPLNIFINGFFDLTKGTMSLAKLNSNNLFKAIILLTFISFGGLNIYIQIASIISTTKIKLTNFCLGRISQTAISSFIFLILYILLLPK